MAVTQGARRRLLASLAGAVVVLAAAGAWLLFAPAAAGGQGQVLTVHGNSMEPAYGAGDLVLLRRSAAYRPGDVVGVRHPDLGVVLHRIVGITPDGLVTKGDNRAEADAYRTQPAEVLGRAWIRIPGAGPIVESLGGPLSLAMLSAAGLASTAAVWRQRHRQRRPDHAGRTRTHPLERMAVQAPSGGGAVLVVAALALGAAGLLGIHARSPATSEQPEAVPYTEKGLFSYQTPAGDGVYDGDAVRAPQPLFRRLGEQVIVRYTYALLPGSADQALTGLTGQIDLTAAVRLDNGWERTLPLTPASTFQGTHGDTEAVLNLREVQRLIDVMEQDTGVESPAYQVRIIARTTAAGALAGEAVTRELEQSLEFLLTDLVLQLDAQRSMLVAEADAHVITQRQVARTLPLLGLTLPYRDLPFIAAGGFLLAALGAGLIGWASWRVRQGGAAARARAEARGLVVDIEERELPLAAIQRPVHIADFGALDALARQRDTTLLRVSGRHGDTYWLFTPDLTYLHTAPAPTASPPPTSADSAPARSLLRFPGRRPDRAA